MADKPQPEPTAKISQATSSMEGGHDYVQAEAARSRARRLANSFALRSSKDHICLCNSNSYGPPLHTPE